MIQKNQNVKLITIQHRIIQVLFDNSPERISITLLSTFLLRFQYGESALKVTVKSRFLQVCW